jgi:hypothetical protein
MDQQCAIVVLDAQAMLRVCLFVEAARPASRSALTGDERSPADPAPSRRRDHGNIVAQVTDPPRGEASPPPYGSSLSPEEVEQIRFWHERAYSEARAEVSASHARLGHV